MTIRYNIFVNSVGGDDGLTAEIGIWSGANHDNIDVYGNIFHNPRQYNTNNRNSIIVIGGNGLDGSFKGVGADNTKVYNNTIVFMDGSQFAEILLNGNNTEAINNLFYDIEDTVNVSADTTSNNPALVSNPFASYSSPAPLTAVWGSHDFHLSGVQAGTILSSPYDEDLDDVTRGGDGTFDIGALEFEA